MPNPNTQPIEEVVEEPSLRETLDAAIEQHEETPEGLAETGLPPKDDAPAATTPPAPPAPPQDGTSPPAPAAPAPPQEGAAPAPAPAAGSDDPTAKAPGTWNPAARDKWATVDPEVRAEIWKREKEVSRAMTLTTNARRFEQEFGQMIQPYLGFIAAEQSTPIRAAQNMMQTAATLRVGTDQQKVAIVADIIKNFKVDLNALDSVLAGQSPEFNPQVQIEQLVNQRVQAAMAQQTGLWQQNQQASLTQNVETELQTFANDPKNEFYNDVRFLMGDLIAGAAQRGERMELSDAYERAILIHEPVRRVIEGRKAQSKAVSTNAAAQRSRQASGGVIPSASAAAGNQNAPKDDSIRAALEFAIDQQQGR